MTVDDYALHDGASFETKGESVSAITNALVVGGGPAGLSTAVALRNAGVAVDLAEIKEDRAVLGSELLISSPNLRLLDTFGLAKAVAAAGVPIGQIDFYAPDGTLYASAPTPNVAPEGLPPSVGITRSAFYGVLYDAAILAGTRVFHDTTITNIVDEGTGVRVHFTSGARNAYDLVVGADGVNSTTRRLRFPDATEPQYSGQCVWRARVPRNGDFSLSAYAGAHTNVGLITVNDEHSYLFCLVNEPVPPRISPDAYPALLKALLVDFRGNAAWSRDHLGGPETIHFSPMWSHVMPRPWHDDRVVLIGDAAHSTTPHVGYGAGLATEDGIVLGEEIAKATSIEDALRGFMNRRFDRCRAVVENSRQICRWQQGLDNPTPTSQATLTAQTWQLLEEPI